MSTGTRWFAEFTTQTVNDIVTFQFPTRDIDPVGDYYAAAQLAARGSSAAEIANRCGIVNGEARVLVALQQARARRTSH